MSTSHWRWKCSLTLDEARKTVLLASASIMDGNTSSCSMSLTFFTSARSASTVSCNSSQPNVVHVRGM